jgi:spermidine synthase
MARKSQQAVKSPAPAAPPRDLSRYFILLLVLFAASGCSALIYEIVWYQLLQLVIGSTAVSLGVLLATFMGGLCLGSIALPRIRAASDKHPLRVYAAVECGIGILGVIVLFLIPLVDKVYVAAVGHGLPAILLRALICAICLLPPTFLMGASLPAVSRWVQTTPRGVSWLGLLYAGNTVGAVFGALFAGFYLLRVYNMTAATLIAAAINLAGAGVAYLLAAHLPEHTAPEDVTSIALPDVARPWPVYITVALSGACALGAEVVWTRLLGLLLGATVYTFSIILAVFLIGLALGSGAGAFASRRINPSAALGYCQLLLVAAIFWTAFTLAKSLPYWPINPLISSGPAFTFQIDLARVLWTIFPATLLWGASFPLGLAAAASRNEDPGRLVGSVYAANTAGAIAGALLFSLILIPAIGTQNCQRAMLIISVIAATVMLAPYIAKSRSVAAASWLATGIVLTIFLAVEVAPVPSELIAYGRRIMTSINHSTTLYTGEGMNSSIAITRWEDGSIQFHVSGKVEASTESYDMRLQRMLGHLPALLSRDPRSVLVVGFGAGVTSGTFVVYPEVQRIVICEMEKLIPPVATEYFRHENYNVFNDPRTQIIYDDARHFVLTTREKFDIITSDPIHPWVKGSATLYSKEYFRLVRDHLNPGGIVTQWVPLYETDDDTVKSEIATFFSVFPDGLIFANSINGEGYDIVLLGEADPQQINVDDLQKKLDQPNHARVVESLRDVGLGSAVDLLSTYAGQDRDLQPWLAGAQINTDANLRLQYMAGLALNDSRETTIFDEMLQYRRFPLNLFVGSDATLRALDEAIEGPRR